MRHWIQNVADRWKTTSPKKEDRHFDYNPNYDKTREYLKDIYKKENEWKRNLQKRLKSVPSTYNSSLGHLPGSISSKNFVTNNTITTTTLADSKITINGGENGSMQVNVPLIVNGRDVMKELDEMRDALLLLKRDVNMEAKYPRLKELKDEYERTLEKYKTFDAIKESK